jgi:hypothetical protein
LSWVVEVAAPEVRTPFRGTKEANVVLLWVLVALVLLFAIVGGIAISKFLFFVLIVAAVLALIGLFTRTA